MESYIIKESPVDSEQTRWGFYNVLMYAERENSNKTKVKRIVVDAGKNISYQKHYCRSEVWTITSGTGIFVQDGRFMKVKQGDILTIPVESWHAIRAITTIEFVEVQQGEFVEETDIIRKFYEWEDIMLKAGECDNG